GAGQGGSAGGGEGGGEPLECVAPLADCNGDRSDGCETSIEDDWVNCGACGRDCGGGDCKSGVCQADFLSIAPYGFGFAVDGDHLYFASHGQFFCAIQRMNASGGELTTLFEGDPTAGLGCFHVAVDDENVYWIDGAYRLQMMPKDAPGAAPTTVV